MARRRLIAPGRARTGTPGGLSRGSLLMDRLHARLAGFGHAATGFVSSPEPQTIGQLARGRQLLAGNHLFAGRLIQSTGGMIWDLPGQTAAFQRETQGCGWLDDLAAIGDARARTLSQTWVLGWAQRFGRGRGPGWTPELTGRRLIRWINHAIFLLRGMAPDRQKLFFDALARQTLFLARRWQAAPRGLPRIEALTGLIHASLSLTGMERHAEPAIAALAADCATVVDPGGGIPSRNPEELLQVLTLLNWATRALAEADRSVPAEISAAMVRIVPVLRALRHSDGSLARFHGGDRGVDGRLDHALATSGVKARGPAPALAMGYLRLTAGRTSLVIDAAPPATGGPGRDSVGVPPLAHASTLAFELTSGRRPLIVNCGSGATFGPEWHRAGRATPSHSTLGIDGFSSSRMPSGQAAFAEVPAHVPWEITPLPDGQRVETAHDGWAATHGLTHARTLDLAAHGRGLAGEDLLATLRADHEAAFRRALDDSGLQGIAFHIRFHLHPETDPSLDLGGAAVSIALRSGEVWVFRHDGRATLTLEPSVYFDSARLRPRPAQQIVLAGRATDFVTRVRWSLAKAQDTPYALRDLGPPDDESEP
jgi:uncharacterized heparinase superfamily protein